MCVQVALCRRLIVAVHGTDDAHIGFAAAVQLEANLKTLANASDTTADSILIEIPGGDHNIADQARRARPERAS